MTREQWRLSRRVIDVLAGAVALTEAQLAERLGATVADVHRCTGMLTGRGLLDRCWTGSEAYFVVRLPLSGQGASAA